MSRLEQMRWRIAHLSQGNYGDSECYMLLSPAEVQLVQNLLEVAEAVMEYIAYGDDCPSCGIGVWTTEDGPFVHIDGCPVEQL